MNKVIWVGRDRKKQILDIFFEKVGTKKQGHILLAVVDMWDPYIASLTNYCPNINIVYDKFHIIKIINHALDNVRKMEFTNTDDKQRKQWKKKRFLILRRNKNLTEKQRETMNELMKQNETLYQAYPLKEQISDIMDEDDIPDAITRMEEWL